MSTHTVELHRVLQSTPARVFRAFTTSGAFAKWLPPDGYFGEVHEMDVRVGGRYRMSFTNLAGGSAEAFGGEYLEVEPGRRLVYTAEFDNPQMPGRMQTTVQLQEVSCGVELRVKQEGIPEFIPEAGCYLGWQSSLAQLARLVEAETGEAER